ncbi:MAG: DNA repair protein RecO [Patescibacteria group bacterium]
MLAIALGRRDLKEFDQVVSLYTFERGKLNLLAKGIKKMTSKNAAGLERPTFSEIEVAEGKEFDHLTKVQALEMYGNIRRDLTKSFLAGYAVRVLDEFTLTEEKDEKIFNLLLNFLHFLNTEPVKSPLNIINNYLLKLWSLFGYGEELERFVKLPAEQLFVIIDKFVQVHNGRPLPDFIKNAKSLGII